MSLGLSHILREYTALPIPHRVVGGVKVVLLVVVVALSLATMIQATSADSSLSTATVPTESAEGLNKVMTARNLAISSFAFAAGYAVSAVVFRMMVSVSARR